MAPGTQMQYRLVPHIIQQPGGPAVVQLQAQPHHMQQASGGQTVIAVQPAQSQQENQQQNAEVNYNQVRPTAILYEADQSYHSAIKIFIIELGNEWLN